jgi:hypothetical protein
LAKIFKNSQTRFQDLESAEDRREREAQDMEYAKELAEDDDDLI